MSPQPSTFCSLLPLPDYPRGRHSFKKVPSYLWYEEEMHDFREAADPSVLYHDGAWYLYPSAGMAYVSTDFVTWTHHRMEPYDCGYAPTVERFRGQFLLTACQAGMWTSESPLGPFREIGPILLPDGTPLGTPSDPGWSDPMLFADGDRLYAYWGIAHPGIFGAELDPEHPNRMLTAPKLLFSYNPEHEWERLGEWNEDPTRSFVEGAWMVKNKGRYYLTYTAPGTTFSSYAMGCYTSDRPLGPFVYQSTNPILRQSAGLIRGPGHGSVVRGPNDTWWAFFTCTACNHHMYERRVGVTPAGFDADGNLFAVPPSELPQRAPGLLPRPELGNSAGLLPVNMNRTPRASSKIPGREPRYATDSCMKTWWQAAPDDREPWLMVYLDNTYTMSAVSILWAEPDLAYDAGRTPTPMKYRLEYSMDAADWKTALDASTNETDLLIDYREFAPVSALWVRLHVLEVPPAGVGVIHLAVFGVKS